ncbi:hypothetical protein [Syntrophomonas curvata]
MVILLKVLSFAIWAGIMLVMIAASRYGSTSNYTDVNIYLRDEDDIEMTIRKILSHIHSRDRLIIHDIAPNNEQLHWVFMKSLIRKNPSIIYYNLGRNFA